MSKPKKKRKTYKVSATTDLGRIVEISQKYSDNPLTVSDLREDKGEDSREFWVLDESIKKEPFEQNTKPKMIAYIIFNRVDFDFMEPVYCDLLVEEFAFCTNISAFQAMRWADRVVNTKAKVLGNVNTISWYACREDNLVRQQHLASQTYLAQPDGKTIKFKDHIIFRKVINPCDNKRQQCLDALRQQGDM